MPKVELINRVGNGGATGIAIAYLVAFFLLLIAGAAGPAMSESFNVASTQPTNCADPTSCVIPWTGQIQASKYNQVSGDGRGWGEENGQGRREMCRLERIGTCILWLRGRCRACLLMNAAAVATTQRCVYTR